MEVKNRVAATKVKPVTDDTEVGESAEEGAHLSGVALIFSRQRKGLSSSCLLSPATRINPH